MDCLGVWINKTVQNVKLVNHIFGVITTYLYKRVTIKAPLILILALPALTSSHKSYRRLKKCTFFIVLFIHPHR